MEQKAVKAIVTDIEGTTTSISFVKDVLFPYAKVHTPKYLKATWQDNRTQQLVSELLNLPEYAVYKLSNSITDETKTAENVAKFVNYLIDKDLKVAPLKTLQGFVWQQGYETGELKGHIFDDVKPAFERWHLHGVQICIYSSGSVKAQKLLFENSVHGNLLPFISEYFDTAIGHKQESQSYKNIAKQLNLLEEDILFLTDIYEEARAAQEAGLTSILLRRPGNKPLSQAQESKFVILNDFKALSCVCI